jgi:predicted oxidoreductase
MEGTYTQRNKRLFSEACCANGLLSKEESDVHSSAMREMLLGRVTKPRSTQEDEMVVKTICGMKRIGAG